MPPYAWPWTQICLRLSPKCWDSLRPPSLQSVSMTHLVFLVLPVQFTLTLNLKFCLNLWSKNIQVQRQFELCSKTLSQKRRKIKKIIDKKRRETLSCFHLCLMFLLWIWIWVSGLKVYLEYISLVFTWKRVLASEEQFHWLQNCKHFEIVYFYIVCNMSHACESKSENNIKKPVGPRDQALLPSLIANTFTPWLISEVLVLFQVLVLLGVMLEVMSPRNRNKSFTRPELIT